MLNSVTNYSFFFPLLLIMHYHYYYFLFPVFNNQEWAREQNSVGDCMAQW